MFQFALMSATASGAGVPPLHGALAEEVTEAPSQPRRRCPSSRRLGTEIDWRFLKIARDHAQQRQTHRPLQERRGRADPIQIDPLPAELQETCQVVHALAVVERRPTSARSSTASRMASLTICHAASTVDTSPLNLAIQSTAVPPTPARVPKATEMSSVPRA